MTPPSAVGNEAIPQQHSREIKAQEHPTANLSPLVSQARSFVQPWSPASTATSTPPFDVENKTSPASRAAVLHKGSRTDHLEGAAAADVAAEEEGPTFRDGRDRSSNPRQSRTQGGGISVRGRQSGVFLRRLLRRIDRRQRNDVVFKVGPKRGTPDAPKSAAVGSADALQAEAGGAAAAAAAHVSVMEVPTVNSVMTKKPPAKLEILADEGLVLPCAPSNDEKVMYVKSGRWMMLTSGFISFCTLLVGMCLFSISSAHFYWFGGPSVFVLVYMCCHYFGVSVWGKDFDPAVHEDIVHKGQALYAPTVDVFLPVCNEPLVLLANTWNHVLALDYPHVTVHVLDDGAKDEVKALAEKYGFEYIRRDNRPELKKAGNLRYAFARTSGEVISIFDADFCPRADFLRETLPYLVDPSIGILQTPQFFRRRGRQTWVEQGAGACQEPFYRLVQVNLDRFNAAVCVGSCAVYRRAAVAPFGGVAPIEHSEDMYTGYKMTEIGFKVKYLPLCLAMGICPDEPRSFFMQQYRWCMGTSTLVLQKEFWQSDIPSIHKLCFFNGMLFYLATALFVFLGPAPIILLIWITAEEVKWMYFGFTVPALVFAAIVVPSWCKQDSVFDALASHRIKVIQSYAHLFAIKDRLTGSVATWVPSGGGAKKVTSKPYDASVRVLLVWNVMSTILIVGGSIWRVTAYPWYHFVIPVFMALCSFALSLSTLWN